MAEATQRLDKWLWFARFAKTRTLAATIAVEGRLRLNGTIVAKAAQPVRVGDVLTFALGQRVKVVRVLALGARRGPPAEARLLYDDLSPPPPPREAHAPVVDGPDADADEDAAPAP
jgi:ribosome-associated heat shock protein Hsp15